MPRTRLARRQIVSSLFAWLLVAMTAGGALAQDTSPTGEATPTPDALPPTPIFAIYPKETGPRTFFTETQAAGTTASYTVVLINAGTEEHGAFTGRTFVVDGRTKVNGGLDTGDPNDPKTGATTWFEYPNEELTLQPGTGIERTFTVDVPEGTPPGQYVVAMCFETAVPIAIEGVPDLTQNLRQTIAFYLTVPGEIRPEFAIDAIRMITSVTWSGIEAEIVNSGNILVRPEGRVTVLSSDGAPLMTTEVGFGAFYAGQTGTIEVGIAGLLPAGEYLVTIELRDPETGATAIVERQPLTVLTGVEAALGEAPPIEFISATGVLRPSADEPQFLQIEATIFNGEDAIADAELSLNVLRDGELVENYVLVAPLSLAAGETRVSSRYIPISGWDAGAWSFTLSIQRLDRETNVAEVLSTFSLGEPIEIE